MDIVATIFSAVTKGMEALAWARKQGYIGGSDDWVKTLTDVAGLWARAQAFALALVSNPAEYDRINGLPQAQKEAEIIKRVYPTPLADLVEKVRDDMGR